MCILTGDVLGGADINLVIRAEVNLKDDERRDLAALYTVVSTFTTNEVGSDYRPQTAWTVAPGATADARAIEQAIYDVVGMSDVAGVDEPTENGTDYTLRVFIALSVEQLAALAESEFIEGLGYPSKIVVSLSLKLATHR